MKIGFVIGTLYYSGAEKIARHLLNTLQEKGHEVGAILLARKEIHEDLAHIKQFPMANTAGRLKGVLERGKRIRNVVKAEKFDVIVAFGAIASVTVLRSVGNMGIPIIACERNDPQYDPQRKSYRILRKIFYPKAAGYVFQTDRIASFFGEKIAKKAAVIPNFIENKYDNLYREDAPNNMVLTARLDDYQKNISMLLRAFKRFTENHDYHLYVVGDGPDEEKFRDYIRNNGLEEKVTLPGRQNVLEYLKNAQIFVMSSVFEGMPNSLIEAMASGIPCISTDFGGGAAAYLIEDHVNGVVVPENDEDAFLAAMEEMAKDAELRKRISGEAYKINNRLEYNRIIAMWIDYICAVANGRNTQEDGR